MEKACRRCLYCHQWFRPNPRTSKTQKACSAPRCRRQRKALADKSWGLRHPTYSVHRRPKVRAWAATYPDYWRHYRRTHPDYVHRDNRRRCLALKRARRSAKQDAIRQISVDRLWEIRAIGTERSAKQDEMFRRMDALLDFLIWKEDSAKHDAIVSTTVT